MTKRSPVLTPAIIAYCKRCSDAEGRSIVAYCCHMSFADKSVRRMEVEFVRAIADQMGITPEETARMAGKARRHRLKIKMPQSKAARKLLFHLALRMAGADDRIDTRERSAIDRLASQLRISSDTVESELRRLEESVERVAPIPNHEPIETTTPAPKPAARKTKGFFANLFDSLTNEWVSEDLEADLFLCSEEGSKGKKGEVEYTRTRDGVVELDIELNQIDMPANETVTVMVSGRRVCDIVIPSGRVDKTIRARDSEGIPRVAIGDSAEIRYRGAPVLTGIFESN